MIPGGEGEKIATDWMVTRLSWLITCADLRDRRKDLDRWRGQRSRSNAIGILFIRFGGEKISGEVV